MGKQRQSNYELLRLILMMIVPLYHLMIYSGITSMPYNKFTVSGLLICSAGGVMADYAFMALSSWFFLEMKDRPIVSRFLGLATQVIFMYIIKFVMVRHVLGFKEDNFYVNDFIMDGSWWFIYIYFSILFIYPVLNKVIYSIKIASLGVICVIFLVWFIVNGITYQTNYVNDLVSFFVTYFCIGYIKRLDIKIVNVKRYRLVLLILFFASYIVTLCTACFVKYPGNMSSGEIASEIVRHLVGRYSLSQFIMGISLFMLFRSIHINYNKYVNQLAQNVFYIFLMHETVMAIFWRFNKIRTIDNQLPYTNLFSFVCWCALYIISCFIFAAVVRFVYKVLLEKWVDKFIKWSCDLALIKHIEKSYQEIKR